MTEAPVPTHEWVRVESCKHCGLPDVDTFYQQFDEDALVTKECTECGAVSEYLDTV